MLKKIGIISLSFLLCACSLGVQLKKSMFTIELGKDIYANPTLYLKNATFSSRLKVVSKSVGVDKKNNRFMTSGMDYLVVGEYDFAIVDGSKEYPFVIKVKDTTAPVCASEVGQITIGVVRILIGIPTFMRQIYRELLLKLMLIRPLHPHRMYK